MTRLAVQVTDLSKSFLRRSRGEARDPVLRDINFNLFAGDVVGLFGPSGCGKSTLLRTICGIISPDSGTSRVFDKSGKPWLGPVAYVPQAQDLFPWKTLLDNALLGSRIGRHRHPEDAVRAAACRFADRFGVSYALSRYPGQISLGERQRVALIRALLTPSPLLALDEPLAAIDYLTRAAISETLSKLIEERVACGEPMTVLMVSHDPEELLLLCDHILVFSHRPARITQTISVPFQRPRPVELRFQSSFVELKQRLWGSLEAPP